SSTLEDELLSLNSIYGDETLVVTSSSAEAEGVDAVLKLPSHPSISLRLFFPSTYSDDPPAVLGTQSVGEDVAKGGGQVAVRVAKHILEKVWRPGDACMYDLCEEVQDVLEQELEDAHISTHKDDIENLQDSAVSREEVAAPQQGSLDAAALGEAPAWVLSDVITEKKSVFVARCVAVSSVDEAQRCIAHLLATDKRAAKATHNISAWRIRALPDSAAYQDFDDDGETAAGGRLLKLLQMMDVWNLVVVVSRWYGGILLGPARFAIINEAARGAVV
ncbi:impact family protein, partial [Rhizodiscina lignyota]